MTKELADILREAIRSSGQTLLAIAQKTGVPQSRISEFLRGGDMKLKSAHKLADYLGLALQKKPKPRK